MTKQCDPERQRLINQMARIIRNIDQFFCDMEFWNNDTRVRLYPNEPPLDSDKDGFLAKTREGMLRSLEHEATLGYGPTITFPPLTPSRYIALADTSEMRRRLTNDVDGRTN